MSKEDGYLIPQVFDEAIVEQARRYNTLNLLFPRQPLLPLTRRQRFRIWRADLRGRVHDWLFPEYRRDDWDD